MIGEYLDEVNVLETQARLPKDLLNGWYGSDPHNGRLHPRNPVANESRERREIVLPYRLLARNDHSSRPVADPLFHSKVI